MEKLIIYNQDNGIPAIIIPTQEAINSYNIIEIAIKDVPAGKKFKIINVEDLPKNIPQEAWLIDEALLNDGVGGVSNEFKIKLAE
jgi:hypothetical protein